MVTMLYSTVINIPYSSRYTIDTLYLLTIVLYRYTIYRKVIMYHTIVGIPYNRIIRI